MPFVLEAGEWRSRSTFHLGPCVSGAAQAILLGECDFEKKDAAVDEALRLVGLIEEGAWPPGR